MKWFIVFLILFAPSCSEAIYRFCPDPGHWNDAHTQYENHAGGHGAGVIFIDGRAWDVSAYNLPIDPALAAYLENITWRKGKVDRNECIELGLLALGVGYDAKTTVDAVGRGCVEVGSLGLLPAKPTWPELIAYDFIFKVGPHWYAFHRTPLAYSSAKHAAFSIGYFGIKAALAGIKNTSCLR